MFCSLITAKDSLFSGLKMCMGITHKVAFIGIQFAYLLSLKNIKH